MPHPVEIPAPVNGTITRAASTSSCSSSIAVSRSGAIMYASPRALFFRRTMQRGHTMRYLHTMLRVRNLDQALDFYCNKLGLKEVRRRVDEKNRYTLVFLAAPQDEARVEESKRSGRDAPRVQLTYNWDREEYRQARYFRHPPYEPDDIYRLCQQLIKANGTTNPPP